MTVDALGVAIPNWLIDTHYPLIMSLISLILEFIYATAQMNYVAR
jgi:hypothetical protein